MKENFLNLCEKIKIGKLFSVTFKFHPYFYKKKEKNQKIQKKFEMPINISIENILKAHIFTSTYICISRGRVVNIITRLKNKSESSAAGLVSPNRIRTDIQQSFNGKLQFLSRFCHFHVFFHHRVKINSRVLMLLSLLRAQ